MRNILIFLVLINLNSMAQDYKVNISKSELRWVGKKITGAHNGNIQLKSGEFTINDNRITKGVFIIDMASMSNIDLIDNPDKMNKLMTHLKSDDFFGVEKYPEAQITIKNSGIFEDEKVEVTGLLTIKGKMHPVKFVVTKKGDIFTTVIIVDRTHYDIAYSSGSFFDNLVAKTINNEFTITIELHTTYVDLKED